MRIFLKELARQPARFVPVGGALTMLVVLLVVLGGFLDGLELNQTGPYRAHEGRLLVFSDDSELQVQRSRVAPDQAERLAEADGVGEVGALNQIASAAEDPDGEIVDVVLFGYGLPTDVLPEPPSDGAVIDQALADRNDVEVGDTLLLGATSEPVEVAEVVDDISQGSPTVWLSTENWREVIASTSPASQLPDGVQQALVIEPSGDSAVSEARLGELADQLDDQDGLDVATSDEVIEALPVVQQQSSTFQGIIGVTFVVTLMVVALFFTLITLERVGLYAVLKALGARTRDLLAGISTQAVCVSVVALVLGVALSVAFVSLLPAELPVRLVPGRLLQVAVGVLVSALVGSLFTLRRVLRIDPAEAIG